MNFIGSRLLLNILSACWDMFYPFVTGQFGYVFLPLLFCMFFISFIKRFIL